MTGGLDIRKYIYIMCKYGRRFNGLQGLHIHKAHWSKQYNYLIGKYELNDEVMNLDYTYSIQEPIVEWQHSREIPNQTKNPESYLDKS